MIIKMFDITHLVGALPIPYHSIPLRCTLTTLYGIYYLYFFFKRDLISSTTL